MGHSLSLALIKCERLPHAVVGLRYRADMYVMVHGPTWSTAKFGKVSISEAHWCMVLSLYIYKRCVGDTACHLGVHKKGLYSHVINNNDRHHVSHNNHVWVHVHHTTTHCSSQTEVIGPKAPYHWKSTLK